MRGKATVAALWSIVVLTAWPQLAWAGWWAAVLVAAAVSVALLRPRPDSETLGAALCEAAFHRNIDAVSVLRDGKFIYANEASVKMAGVTSMEQFLSAEPSRFAPPTQPDGVSSGEKSRQMLAEAIAKGSCRAEWTRKHEDGHLIPVEITLIPVVVGGKTCVIGYYHDISGRVRMRQERDALLASLITRLDALVQRVVQEVKASSDALTADAAALARGLQTSSEQLALAAAGSDEASAVVATIAAATEQLSGATMLVMDQVSSRRAVTQAAVAESEVVSATISRLSEAGDRIGDVVGMIAGIASQTNMLALNATIEAARAGDAGRSFAVVANEVKNLAIQTAKATAEVQAQVGQMQTAMEDAVVAIGRIGATIHQLTDTAETMGRAVEDQGHATKEIARSTAHAAQGVTAAAAGISQVVTLTQQSASVAEQVRVRAGALDSELAMLRTEVEHFRSSVAAA
jgi:methyl-accepting chemotaxis protein